MLTTTAMGTRYLINGGLKIPINFTETFLSSTFPYYFHRKRSLARRFCIETKTTAEKHLSETRCI